MRSASRRYEPWQWSVGVLLIAFAAMLLPIQAQSLWLDEAFSAYAVRDASLTAPETPRQLARFVVDSTLMSFQRVRDDVHPPLYYLLLDAWTLLTGHSEFSLRVPSALMGILTLAATYALGVRLFSRRAALLAMIVLASAGFFLYYTREARMYTLYTALVTLAAWLYVRWQAHPTWQHGTLYALVMTLALYTHYISVLILLAQGVHLLLSLLVRREWRWRVWLPFLLASVAFAAWLPFLARQLALHPAGAAANPLPSNLSSLAALWLILTSGYWVIFVIPMLAALPHLRDDDSSRRGASFLLLWLILPPALLLLLNTQLAVYQLRYLLPIVPAWALLVGWALATLLERGVPFLPPNRIKTLAGSALAIFFTGWLVYTQIAMYDNFWADKPRWRDAVTQAANARQPLDGMLAFIEPAHPTGYYAPRANLMQGYSIDIGWQTFTPAQINTFAVAFTEQSAVWVVAPMQAPQGWDAIWSLTGQGRGVTYHDSVQGTIFYRFAADTGDALAFQFGDALRYTGGFQQIVDGEACITTPLQTLRPLPQGITAELHITRGYHEVIAQQSKRLEPTAADETLVPEWCLDLDAIPAPLHLRLYMRDGLTGERLPLIENSLLWGDFLVVGTLADE